MGSESKEDVELTRLLGDFEHGQKVLGAIAEPLIRLGGSYADLRRVIDEPDLAANIAQLIMRRAVAAHSPTAAGQYGRNPRKNPRAKALQPLMRVTLGAHPSRLALGRAIKDAGIKMTSGANDVLRQSAVSAVPEEVEVVRVSTGDLGGDMLTLEQVYAAGARLGLELSAEAGMLARLGYRENEPREHVMVAMPPIRDRLHNFEFILEIFKGDVHYHLGDVWVWSDSWKEVKTFPAETEWLFVRRRKKRRKE
jgi:hypothetical protein